jgi:hypothetical protein
LSDKKANAGIIKWKDLKIDVPDISENGVRSQKTELRDKKTWGVEVRRQKNREID